MPPQVEAALPQGARVSIVGLGLMGGSLAAALKERRPDLLLTGCARRSETRDQALTLGLVDRACEDPDAAVLGADLIVLATPVRAVVALVRSLAPLLEAGAVLTDIASTKGVVVAAMADGANPAACAGGHPMCGKERHGLAAADGRLYQGATWAVCPTGATERAAMARVQALATAVGATPLEMDAAEHDAVVARTSHLPYAVAAALARSVARDVSDADLARLSAGGYRDTTRLAHSDPVMMLDILLTNREQVLAALEGFTAEVEAITALLRASPTDETALRAYLEQAGRDRRIH